MSSQGGEKINREEDLRKDVERWKEQAHNWKVSFLLMVGLVACMGLWQSWQSQKAQTKAIEIATTSSALTSAEYDTRTTSSMTTESTADPVSVPVLLNASCTAWLDQYGNAMSIEEADEFFSKNRKIAEDIRLLNDNPYYATRLYSSERKDFLTESWRKWDNVWEQEADETCPGYPGNYAWSSTEKGDYPEVDNKALEEIYLQLISEQRPSSSVLNSLEARLQTNFAAYAVNAVIQDCDAREYTENSYCTLSERLFFACLAKFNEDGTMDVLCDQPVGRIPSMLLADGTWYDQNGNVMTTAEINHYLDGHIALRESLEDMLTDLQRKQAASSQKQPKVMKTVNTPSKEPATTPSPADGWK